MAPDRSADADFPPGGAFRHGLMLVAALSFLALVGVLLPHGDDAEAFRELVRQHPWHRWGLALLWWVIVVEAVWGLSQAADGWAARLRRLVLIGLMPPLRMVAATSTPDGWLWIPGVGWRRTGPETSIKMEHKLAVPMLVLTLLVVPVLVLELSLGDSLERHPRLAMALHLATSLIWIGFTAEFLWMIAATPQKLAYCQRHWIHLVIILLPLVAFLRTLRLLNFGRFFRAGKLLRAYRLRTLTSRLWRVMLLLDLLDRIQQRHPEKYCAKLERQIEELNDQILVLRSKLTAFKRKLPADEKGS